MNTTFQLELYLLLEQRVIRLSELEHENIAEYYRAIMDAVWYNDLSAGDRVFLNNRAS